MFLFSVANFFTSSAQADFARSLRQLALTALAPWPSLGVVSPASAEFVFSTWGTGVYGAREFTGVLVRLLYALQ